MHADRSCHGSWNSLVTYLCETIGVLPALDSAIWQWILQTAVGFRQIIRTSHTDILYYNISNHRNNCKTAFIGLYLFGSHTLWSALILAWLSTHGSPSVFHILTSFVRTSLITLFTNRPCHGPWRGLGDCDPWPQPALYPRPTCEKCLIISGRISLKQRNEQADYMFYLPMAPFSWYMARQQHIKCNSLGGELGGRWHDPDRCCGQYFSRKMSRGARRCLAEKGSPQHSRKYFQIV